MRIQRSPGGPFYRICRGLRSVAVLRRLRSVRVPVVLRRLRIADSGGHGLRPRGGLFQRHGDAGSGQRAPGFCSIRIRPAMARAIGDVLLDRITRPAGTAGIASRRAFSPGSGPRSALWTSIMRWPGQKPSRKVQGRGSCAGAHEVPRCFSLLAFCRSAESLRYSINWASGLSLGEATLTSARTMWVIGKRDAALGFRSRHGRQHPGFAIRDHYHSGRRSISVRRAR